MTRSKKVRRWWIWDGATALLCLLFIGTRSFLFERKSVTPPPNNGPVAVTPDTSGVWEFNDATLAEAAKRIAVASGTEIIIAPEVAMLRVSGKFKLGEVDSFLRVLPQAFPIRVDADGAKRFRIRSK